MFSSAEHFTSDLDFHRTFLIEQQSNSTGNMSDYFSQYDRIRLDMITSSHGLEHRFLPKFLFHEFLLDCQFKFTQPFLDAKGGRRLNKRIVHHIFKRIDRNVGLGFRQCQVLMLGNSQLVHNSFLTHSQLVL